MTRISFEEIITANTIANMYRNAIGATDSECIDFEYVFLPYPDNDKKIEFSFVDYKLERIDGNFYIDTSRRPRKLSSKQWQKLYDRVIHYCQEVEKRDNEEQIRVKHYEVYSDIHDFFPDAYYWD